MDVLIAGAVNAATGSGAADPFHSYMSTSHGAQWLAITVDEWEQRILGGAGKAAETQNSLHEWLGARYNEMLENPDKVLESMASATMQPLQSMSPFLATEEFLRARLRTLVARNLRYWILFFAWRVVAAGAAVEAAKKAAKRGARAVGPRARMVVSFLLDVLLPTAYAGPALGIYLGIVRLLGCPSLVVLHGLGSSSDDGSDVSVTETTEGGEHRVHRHARHALTRGVVTLARRRGGGFLGGVFGRRGRRANVLLKNCLTETPVGAGGPPHPPKHAFIMAAKPAGDGSIVCSVGTATFTPIHAMRAPKA